MAQLWRSYGAAMAQPVTRGGAWQSIRVRGVAWQSLSQRRGLAVYSSEAWQSILSQTRVAVYSSDARGSPFVRRAWQSAVALSQTRGSLSQTRGAVFVYRQTPTGTPGPWAVLVESQSGQRPALAPGPGGRGSYQS